MIPETIKAITTQARRFAELRAWLTNSVEQGKPIYITEMNGLDEPWHTLVNMIVDGHAMNGGSPQVDPSLAIQMPRVRLLSIDGKPIKVKRREERRIAATDKYRTEQVWKDLGSDVTIDHVTAREILWNEGHPNKDSRTKGNRPGRVVEVAWLEAEVKKADCYQEFHELYARLKPAIDNEPKPTAKRGPAGQGQLSA